MWQEMERLYLPSRDYGDLPHVGDGGFWQFQRHIYLCPVLLHRLHAGPDVRLATVGSRAARSGRHAGGLQRLCPRGGEAPFQELARSAGLVSPFQAGCLKDVVDQARMALGV